jgi:hypothetical protein
MRFAHRRESAEGSPTSEQVHQWLRRTSAPENELPAGAGVTVLLGRTGDAAVGITQVEAFSTGFRFNLAVRLRRAGPEHVRGGLYMLVSSHVRPDVQIPVEDRLLLGLEYSDGRRASTLQDMHRFHRDAAPDDEQLVLAQQGGGGGDLSVDQGYWVSPLPPEGPVTIVLAWPAFGMPESRTVVDSAAIRAAGERSQLLWPPQPVTEPPEPPPPPAPSSGWFAEPPG